MVQGKRVHWCLLVFASLLGVASASKAEDPLQAKLRETLLSETLEFVEPAADRVKRRILRAAEEIKGEKPELERDLDRSIEILLHALEEIVIDAESEAVRMHSTKQLLLQAFELESRPPIGQLSTELAVKSELLRDPRVAGLSISVESVGPHIVLKGEVDTRRERALIEELATGIVGLHTTQEVYNEIVVAPEEDTEYSYRSIAVRVFFAFVGLWVLFYIVTLLIARYRAIEDNP